jgi:hypothetical protein
MKHLTSISKQSNPAFARSLLEWEQLANVLLLFTELAGGIIGVFSDVLGLGKEE